MALHLPALDHSGREIAIDPAHAIGEQFAPSGLVAVALSDARETIEARGLDYFGRRHASRDHRRAKLSSRSRQHGQLHVSMCPPHASNSSAMSCGQSATKIA